jgi:protein SCO1
MQRRHMLYAGASACAALSCPALVLANPNPKANSTAAHAGSTLPWAKTTPREQFRKRHFPEMRLRTHQGKEVRLYEDLIKDKIVLINFIYLNCSDGTCPVTSFNMSQLQPMLKGRLGRDVFIYSITIDPENDSIELLDRYAKSFKAEPGWVFLRAEPKATEVLRKSLGFVDKEPEVDAKKSNHLSMIRMGNEPHVMWSTASAIGKPQNIYRSLQLIDKPVPAASQRGIFSWL